MANREENIKKINEALEKLDDEQLDQVAGGTYNETAVDSSFLHLYKNTCVEYSFWDILGCPSAYQEEDVKATWRKFGIKMVYHSVKSNEYYLDGKEISRAEAYLHVIQTLGFPSKNNPNTRK